MIPRDGREPAPSAAFLRRLDPARSVAQILFYRLCYWIVMLAMTFVYRARFCGSERVPRAGGVLIIANHQSFLDPPLIGIAVRHRNVAPIAREGLFRVPVLAQVLRGLGCIAIHEEEGDAGAMKKAIAALKSGRVVVIFPEGSRSPDGRMGPFKRGFWLLLSRSGVPVVPAAVEGCFDAWPRGRRIPRLLGRRVAACFGDPIPFEVLKQMGPAAGLPHLHRIVDNLRAGLRSAIDRSQSSA